MDEFGSVPKRMSTLRGEFEVRGTKKLGGGCEEEDVVRSVLP